MSKNVSIPFLVRSVIINGKHFSAIYVVFSYSYSILNKLQVNTLFKIHLVDRQEIVSKNLPILRHTQFPYW